MQTESESWFTVETITQSGATYQETAIDKIIALENLGEFVSQDGRGWWNPDHAALWTL